MVLKLLSLPVIDLRETILEEAEKNPALEIVRDPLFDKNLNVRNKAEFRSSSHTGAEARLASDNFQAFLENIEETRNLSLQSHLLKQAGFIKTDEETAILIRLIIQNLDGRGFHQVPIEELINAQNENIRAISKSKLREALKIVQKLDPPGCAVSGFKESLVIQAKYFYEENSVNSNGKEKICLLAAELLEKHFERLKSGKASGIVKGLESDGIKVSVKEAEEVLKFIKTLTPFPGSVYSGERIEKEYITPDIYVKKNDEGFSAVINNEEIPIVKISPAFKDVAEKADSKKEEKRFACEAVKSANRFLEMLTLRRQTILKVVQAIIIFQQDFFKFGPAWLCPLRLKDVAEEVGFSISTISRVSKGKYLDCEWGIFEIGYFFTLKVVSNSDSYNLNPHQSYCASGVSKETIKAAIKEIIETSDKKLSDRKISDILKKRKLPVSRRTVNKYRSEMQIASSYGREK